MPNWITSSEHRLNVSLTLDYWSDPKLELFDHLNRCKRPLNHYSQPYNWRSACAQSLFWYSFHASPKLWWSCPSSTIASACPLHWIWLKHRKRIFIKTEFTKKNNKSCCALTHLMHVTELPCAWIDIIHSVFIVVLPNTVAFPQRCSWNDCILRRIKYDDQKSTTYILAYILFWVEWGQALHTYNNSVGQKAWSSLRLFVITQRVQSPEFDLLISTTWGERVNSGIIIRCYANNKRGETTNNNVIFCLSWNQTGFF